MGLFTATRRARSRVAATPCAGCPLSYRRHPPPVPPGEELGVHLATEAPLTHDTRVSGIRFSVKRSGPSTQDTFDRIDIRRPLTPPSPRELWRRSRTPGSPACRPPSPRQRGKVGADGSGACAPRMRSTESLPTRHEPRRPAPRSFPDGHLAALLGAAAGSTTRCSPSVDITPRRPVFPPVRRDGSDLVCPVTGCPGRRTHCDDTLTSDRGRFPPIRVNVIDAPRPRTPRVAEEPSSGPPPASLGRAAGWHSAIRRRARPSSPARPPRAPDGVSVRLLGPRAASTTTLQGTDDARADNPLTPDLAHSEHA